MSDLPFITVFTPNYNKSKFLVETIESVLNQTYTKRYALKANIYSQECERIIQRNMD